MRIMPGNFVIIQRIEINLNKGIGFAQRIVQIFPGLQLLKSEHNMLCRAEFVRPQIHAINISSLIFKIPQRDPIFDAFLIGQDVLAIDIVCKFNAIFSTVCFFPPFIHYPLNHTFTGIFFAFGFWSRLKSR